VNNMLTRRLLVFCGLLIVDTNALGQEVSLEPIVAALTSIDGSKVDGKDVDGKVVVFSPIGEKMTAMGLKWDELRKVIDGRRFIEGEWYVELKKEKINLAQLAKIETRPLEIPQFTVALPDGRELTVTPTIAKIGGYRITGQRFVDDVRRRLDDLFVEDPLAVTVLSGISNPGPSVPSWWACSPTRCINGSVGEPLNHLAKLDVRGAKGQHIADLERMRKVRQLVEKAVEAEENTPRADFERHFGVVAEKDGYGRTYPLGKRGIQVSFGGEPETVWSIYFQGWTEVPAKSPRDSVKKRGISLSWTEGSSSHSFKQSQKTQLLKKSIN